MIRTSHVGTTGSPSPGRCVEFSIVIPAFNERDDIVRTLRSAVTQTLPPLEILVIDDCSTDGTAEVVEALHHPRVRVLRQDRNRGAGASRNTGVRAARGDVVVFLDADDELPATFLSELDARYGNGFDCIGVESRVADQRRSTGRFLEAEHSATYDRSGAAVGWTAAFSCRRELALAAPFPELPGCGGEDGAFFHLILGRGARSTLDRSIVITRHVPTDLGGFWRQGIARGKPVAYVDSIVAGRGRAMTTLRRLAATFQTAARVLLVVPAARDALRYARRSPRGWRDAAAFWALYHVRLAANRAGEWAGVVRLWTTPEAQS